MNTNTIRNVVGVIGNVISSFLFLSPHPTFYHIFKKEDVEEFHPYPYIATVLNCMLWCVYGLPFVTPDSIVVMTTNSAGLFLELAYVAIFWWYSNKNPNCRRNIIAGLIADVIIFCGVVIPTLAVVHGPKERSTVIGVVAGVVNIIMYCSPMTVMMNAWKTNSVEYMPFYLSLANLLNGTCWMIYGSIVGDHNLLISNLVGALAGLSQVLFYAYIRIGYGNHKPTPPKDSELQLSTGDASFMASDVNFFLHFFVIVISGCLFAYLF